MKHENISKRPRNYIAVRIPSDAECNDLALQQRVCDFLYSVSAVVPRRRLDDCLRHAALRCRTVLLDSQGNRAMPADLSDDDHLNLADWLRDYIRPRPPHVVRRNRAESLERRRYILALCRMAWPHEMAAHSNKPEYLGLERTHLEPLTEWD